MSAIPARAPIPTSATPPCPRSPRPIFGRTANLTFTTDVFMSGGDVEAGMSVLSDRGLVEYVRGLHAAGKPFFGISAGSIMLCRDWVRWRDPDDDGSAETFPCLGLAPVWCDTHAEGDAFEELRALLRLLPEGGIGYGIPSGAGLAVSGRGDVAAVGKPVWRFGKRRGGVSRLEDVPVRHGLGK